MDRYLTHEIAPHEIIHIQRSPYGVSRLTGAVVRQCALCQEWRRLGQYGVSPRVCDPCVRRLH